MHDSTCRRLPRAPAVAVCGVAWAVLSALPLAAAPPDGRVRAILVDPDMTLRYERFSSAVTEARYADAVGLARAMLEHDAPGLLIQGEDRGVSLRAVVERRLQEGPPPLLEAYRAAVEHVARKELETAGWTAEDRLSRVAARWFLTRSGARAAWRLAGWHADRGRWHASRRWLQRVKQHPDAGLDPSVLAVRLRAAEAMAGGRPLTPDEIEKLCAVRGIVDAGRRAVLDRWIAGRQAAAAAEAADGWRWRSSLESQPAAGGVSPATAGPGAWAVAWETRLDWHAASPSAPDAVEAQLLAWRGQGTPTTARAARHYEQVQTFTPRVDGGQVLVSLPDAVVCLDAATGARAWSSGITNLTHRAAADQQYVTQRRSWRYRAGATSQQPRPIAFDAGSVYCLRWDLPVSRKLYPWVEDEAPTTLAAIDRRDGSTRWAVTETAGDGSAVADLAFIGVPVIDEEQVLTAVVTGRALSLRAYDSATGAQRWNTDLDRAEAASLGLGRAMGSVILVADGTAYVAVGNGMVAAVETRTGHPQWVVSYAAGQYGAAHARTAAQVRLNGVDAKPRDGVLAASDALLVAMAADADGVIGIDRASGTVRYRSGKPGVYARILGVTGDGGFVVHAADGILRLDPVQGRERWSTPVRALGWGTLKDGRVYVPVQGALLALDAATGEIVQRHAAAYLDTIEPYAHLSDGGDGTLLLASVEGVRRLVPLAEHLARLRAGESPGRERRIVKALLDADRHDDALAAARGARTTLPGPAAAALLFDTLLEAAAAAAAEEGSEACAAHLAEAAGLEIDPGRRRRVELCMLLNAPMDRGAVTKTALAALEAALDPDPALIAAPGRRLRMTRATAGRGVLRQVLRAGEGTGLRPRLYARAADALATFDPADLAAHARLAAALPGSPAALEGAVRMLEGGDPLAGEVLLLACARSRNKAVGAAAWRRLAAWYEARGWPRSAALAAGAVQDPHALFRARHEKYSPRLPPLPWSVRHVERFGEWHLSVTGLDEELPVGGLDGCVITVGTSQDQRRAMGAIYRADGDDAEIDADLWRVKLECRELPALKTRWELMLKGNPRTLSHDWTRLRSVVLRSGHLGLLVAGNDLIMVDLLNGGIRWAQEQSPSAASEEALYYCDMHGLTTIEGGARWMRAETDGNMPRYVGILRARDVLSGALQWECLLPALAARDKKMCGMDLVVWQDKALGDVVFVDAESGREHQRLPVHASVRIGDAASGFLSLFQQRQGSQGKSRMIMLSTDSRGVVAPFARWDDAVRLYSLNSRRVGAQLYRTKDRKHLFGLFDAATGASVATVMPKGANIKSVMASRAGDACSLLLSARQKSPTQCVVNRMVLDLEDGSLKHETGMRFSLSPERSFHGHWTESMEHGYVAGTLARRDKNYMSFFDGKTGRLLDTLNLPNTISQATPTNRLTFVRTYGYGGWALVHGVHGTVICGPAAHSGPGD